MPLSAAIALAAARGHDHVHAAEQLRVAFGTGTPSSARPAA
jgi:hypothetical protein